jgi:hypothetical protein
MVELTKDRFTIGRFAEFNDIALEPDPQQLVSRVHCAIERDSDGWWIVDNGSVNKTFIQREETMHTVHGRALLKTGDIIRLLGQLTEKGEPIYWELTFYDPWKTQVFKVITDPPYLEYDWLQAKLFRVEGAKREEIENLRPQEHKLIRYLDQRNRANGNVAVMCTYEELISAIWGDEVGHTEAEINRLVWGLRQKIELQPKEPLFLQTVTGLGYRLLTQPLAD